MSKLHNIAIFPIKSLDRKLLPSAQLLESGALKGDREFAIFDESDRVVNAKRTAKIHQIRSHYDLQNRSVTLSVMQLLNQSSSQSSNQSQSPTLHLDGDRKQISDWLSEFFGFAVHLKQDLEMGFPDDPASPGPTVISTKTLQTIASWYDGMTLEECRSRFRTNLELDTPIAFWEDQLFGKADEIREFTIGSVVFQAVNPCQRCIVPTRNSISGDVTNAFQKTFLNMRLKILPDGVERSRFNHFYRLAVNTKIVPNQTDRIIALGDDVVRSDGSPRIGG
jgi:uncharacterized protein